jgi:ribosomal protein S18 acetylase RimI-like enzyme
VTSSLQPLTWDSEFFAVPIARITEPSLDDAVAAAVLREARQVGLRCLYFEADPHDLTTVITAERNGFHLVDVRVVLEYVFADRETSVEQMPTVCELAIQPGRESDLPCLEAIAVGIGHLSRYAFDPEFRSGDGERLYREWIKNAFYGLADVVLVARFANDGDAAVGLIACANANKIAHIQLAGVHPRHRQKGVGTRLVQAALGWARQQGAREMRVVTQARNVPAQRLYQQMGFFTRSMTLFYHKWL